MTTNNNEINITRDMAITVPSGDSESYMAIRRYDWERITKGVLQLSTPKSKLPIFYSILFGFAASSGVTIIPLYLSEGLPSWVTPLYVCLFFFSMLTAFVFVHVDKGNNTESESNIKAILDEMESLRTLYAIH